MTIAPSIHLRSTLLYFSDVLQRFVVILYDRTSLATDVNTARRELFTKNNRALENTPPTEVRAYHTQMLVVFVYDRLNLCMIG